MLEEGSSTTLILHSFLSLLYPSLHCRLTLHPAPLRLSPLAGGRGRALHAPSLRLPPMARGI